MRKESLVLLVIIALFSTAMLPVEKKKVIINGDTIIGCQKDIERFQECEQFLIDWFISKGYNLSYDVYAEFTSDVASKLSEEDREDWLDEYKLGGLFYDGKLYVTGYYEFLEGTHSKFNIEYKLDMVQRGIIIHELMHCYLGKYGMSPINDLAVHEYMATIAEIDSYELSYRSGILKKAANLIARYKYSAPKYVMSASNYRRDPEVFQILSYWVYKIQSEGILIDSIMSML